MASGSEIELQPARTGTATAPWWALGVAALGIVAGLLTWFAAEVRGRLGLSTIVTLLVLNGAGVAAFFWFLVPTRNPIHPLGAAVPYALAGFSAAGLACLVTALSVALSGGWRSSSTSAGRGPSRRTAVIAGGLAVLLVSVTGLAVVDASRAYLLAANEYWTAEDVGAAPGDAPPSTLTGGDHWRIAVPGLAAAKPVPTAYGLAVASGQSVVMIDLATGAVRWRYTRSDIVGSVSVAGTGDGQLVLASWGAEATYILDARTGKRVGRWTSSDADTTLLDPALPVVARAAADGSVTILRLGLEGRPVWSYDLGPCERARATVAETVVVLAVEASCGEPSHRVVGLDAGTGAERWTADVSGDVRGVLADAVLVFARPEGVETVGLLTAVDLTDGGTRWSRSVPRLGTSGPLCDNPYVAAMGQVAGVVCEFDVADGPNTRGVTVTRLYDGRTGAVSREMTHDATGLVTLAVAADGRGLALYGDLGRGCVLEALTPDAAALRSVIMQSSVHDCSANALVVVGRQVLVADPASETLRSLR